MKLAAIYNVWDGDELLAGSIRCVRQSVDEIIIVYQTQSNYGEQYNPLPGLLARNPNVFRSDKIHFVEYTPIISLGAMMNEKNKRNLGLESARQKGCTHFLHMDCDEYYRDFPLALSKYIESGRSGSVCRLYTYFKRPTLRFQDPDGYYVPFIHELRADTVAGGPAGYPYYVDPTRRINCNDVALLPVFMHHYSWVRQDIERKCRNSTARKNIERGSMLDSYNAYDVGDGYFVKDYNQKLVCVDDVFNLSPIFKV